MDTQRLDRWAAEGGFWLGQSGVRWPHGPQGGHLSSGVGGIVP